MKVIQNTRDQLVLRHTAWIMGAIVTPFIVLFTGIGLYSLLSGNLSDAFVMLLMGPVICGLIFAIFVRRDTLHFDRVACRVHVKNQTARGRKMRTFALDQLKRAELDIMLTVRDNQSGTSELKSVVLIIGAETVQINGIYKPGPAAQIAVDTINDWLVR